MTPVPVTLPMLDPGPLDLESALRAGGRPGPVMLPNPDERE